MARILRMHKLIAAHCAVNKGIIRRMADRLACPRRMTDPGATVLPMFAEPPHPAAMSTMNISLPDSLKAFVPGR